MLDISQKNRDTVLNSNIENKDDFIFLSEHMVSCIKTNNKPNRLFNAFALALDGKAPETRPEISDTEGMKRHKGYHDKEGSLTDGQRNAINRLNTMKSGDFIAIAADDERKKLEAIKSIVYTSYITEALGDGSAPVIFYAGEDKSIDALLRSFRELESKAPDNILFRHWLQNVNSTATYVSRTGENSEYQQITKDGQGFINHADVARKIEENKKLMIYNCYLVFDVSYTDLTSCKEALHTRIFQLDDTKGRILDAANEINAKGIKIDFSKDKDTLCKEYEKNIEEISNELNKPSARLALWKEYFDNEPKGLPFLIKKKIKERFNAFITEEERQFITEEMTYPDVEKIYTELIRKQEEKYSGRLNEEKLKLAFFRLLDIFKKNGVDIGNDIKTTDIYEINRIMDSTVRYHELWYTIHYYECRWLMGEFSLKDSMKNSITREAIEKRYRRLSMISPLLVSKFSDIPFNLFSYVSEDKPIAPVYDFVDILIIDNADSIDAGIAAGTMYLAKRAVVIGKRDAEKESLLIQAGIKGISEI